MRFIKLIIISVIVLFAIATAISLMLPSKVLVSRATDITTNADSVKPLITNLSKWQQWMKIDSTGALKYDAEKNTLSLNNSLISIKNNTDSTFITTWGNGTGKNEIESTHRIISMSPNTITIQWQMVQYVKWYPWEKFASMLNDKILGTFMEQSLSSLKQKAEQH